jgi:hypothetical protein
MNTNNCILLIGGCGSGKTWVMLNLLSEYQTKRAGYKLFKFSIDEKNKIAILGVYDDTTFQGSDRLSMGVMKDAKDFQGICNKNNLTIIAEGDRFTNKPFIELFKPVIIKIKDDGSVGRAKRNSKQTDRQIKSIQTRVNNTKSTYDVDNSSEALLLIKKILSKWKGLT